MNGRYRDLLIEMKHLGTIGHYRKTHRTNVELCSIFAQNHGMKIAVFPGSFDPITRGHESILRRALPLFDKTIVAVGVNSDKSGYFPVEKRLEWLNKTFADLPQVSVESYVGLTVDFCTKVDASYIVRGLRTSADFEFERGVAQVNLKLESDIETVFLLALPEYVMVTSSIVREVHKHGGNIDQFIPEQISI